ncbi:MAG: winged helix-turn-helix domain-containing protein [Oscillospiraceae bacterium]|nr:winged helix-turn-helix domain-containing protein [Oscillospiraceae bacterium]
MTWELSSGDALPTKIIKGPFSLDLLSNQALLRGNVLELTNKELKLLYLCIQNEGKIIDYETIAESVWQRPMGDNMSVVQAAVKRFRQKINTAGYDICAVRGKGYLFSERKS